MQRLFAAEDCQKLGINQSNVSRLLQLRPEFYPIFKELESGSLQHGLFREMGADCSGPNVPMCRCRKCSGNVADPDHTRLSDHYRWLKTEEVIKAVKAKRRRP